MDCNRTSNRSNKQSIGLRVAANDVDDKAIEQAASFLKAIFAPGDQILLRPIETWTEEGGKKSRVDYDGIRHIRSGLVTEQGEYVWNEYALRMFVFLLANRSEVQRTNCFFGVSPRFGDGGKYDQAWQIRIVRVLWADIDDAKPAQAIERCKQKGLPEPSIVVSSGRGTHLYWILTEPFLIDDAGGDPVPVETEWLDQGPGKKKKLRRYIVDASGETLYLDKPHNIPALSPKAQQFQDILAGIAAKIGGDHTKDISRLLRVPGTLNRKDQRNGNEPTKCELIECEPSRRYSINDFTRFAGESPHKGAREAIAKVKLPAHRKQSPKKIDAFNALVLACDTAPVGQRSDADWNLVCSAIEFGMTREEVWAQVQNVGKFKDDERYFNLTWDRAEGHTRQKIFEKAEKKTNPVAEDETKKVSDAGLIADLAEQICEQQSFARDCGGRLYHFADGVYKSRGEDQIKRAVKKLCKLWGATDEWNTRLANEVVEFIRVDANELSDRPPLDLLNLRNGLLRISDRTLLPHSPELRSTIQLPVIFDPTATCPEIEKFVHETFPSDATELAWEIPGYLMLPQNWIQKAILFTGGGGNGKSTYLETLRSFLGRPNTSGISLHKLEADKFAAARLYGKLANICPDLPTEHLAGTSTFKALTGGDTVVGEYKFKDSFDFIPFARLVFSANSPPRSQDSSTGFFDRWLVIPFERSFRGTSNEVPRNILDAKLSTEIELSGLLNKALDASSRVASQHGFTLPASVQRAWQEFHATTDPLAVWLDQHTIDDPSAVVVKKTLRVAFNAYLERQGRPAITETAFGIAFGKHRSSVEVKQRTVSGKTQWCYVGIGLHSRNETDSQASQGSQGSTYIYHTREQEQKEQIEEGIIHSEEQDRGNPVNPVNSVNGNGHTKSRICTHPDHINPETWIHRGGKAFCPGCGNFRGRIPEGANRDE